MLKDREEKVSSSLKLAEENQKKLSNLKKKIKTGQEEARKTLKKQ